MQDARAPTSTWTHVPFGRWRMRIDTPVSVAVRADGIVATCGQCDLSRDGQVQHADDLRSQVAATAAHLARALEDVGARPAALGRLELFYVPSPHVDEVALRTQLVSRLAADGSEPDILLVPLPYFYYEGMTAELDGQLDERGEVHYVTVDGEDVDDALTRLGDELARRGSSADRILLMRTYGTGPTSARAAARAARGYGVPATDIRLPWLPVGARIAVTAAGGDRAVTSAADGTGLVTAACSDDGVLGIAGLMAPDACTRAGLTGQTEAVMDQLAATLAHFGASMRNLVKVNVHYRGGPTPADLHRGLAVRSRGYARPGPASTGVPLAYMEPDGAELVLDALARL